MPPAVLALVDAAGVRAVRPGRYRVLIGVDGAAEGRAAAATLTVTGARDEVLFSLPKARAAHATAAAAAAGGGGG